MIKAALLILEKDGKVIFAKRAKTKKSLPGRWSLPSETMKGGESVEKAAVRCAREELGLKIDNITVFDTFHFNDEFEDKTLYFVKVTYSGKPVIKAKDELSELKQLSFQEFFDIYSDEAIGHGLQHLRKRLEGK